MLELNFGSDKSHSDENDAPKLPISSNMWSVQVEARVGGIGGTHSKFRCMLGSRFGKVPLHVGESIRNCISCKDSTIYISVALAGQIE